MRGSHNDGDGGTNLETPPVDDDEADGDGHEEDDEVLVVIVLHEDVEQLQ